ncbi:XdhC family protein [Brenneria sp. 4F2]|nr:XdhC family protein [Brenneria bubanii]
MGLFSYAAELEKNNRSFAFIQIVECHGSTPRHDACMLMDDLGNIMGTIGGGMMERRVLEQATDALAKGESRIFQGRMARRGEGAIGADCGGAMTVHIAVHAKQPQLVLIGGGHVNRAIAQLAAHLAFTISVVDTWQENLTHPQLPAVCSRLHCETFTQGINQLALDNNSFVIIATNSSDREALSQLIHADVGYLGLLASRRKVQTLKAALQENGVSDERIGALRSPIGLDIGAETPAEIAISVLAEVLLIKNNAKGKSMNIVDQPQHPSS